MKVLIFFLLSPVTDTIVQIPTPQVWVAENYIEQKGCPQSCSFSDDDWAILRLTKPLGEKFGWFGILEFSPASVELCNACQNGMVGQRLL